MQTLHLVDTVGAARDALFGAGAPAPQVLFLVGTGSATLAASLGARRSFDLSTIDGLPTAWHDRELHTGSLGGARAWMIDDGPREEDVGAAEVPGWVRALPCWLAASAGATVCVHTSAGIALEGGRANLGVGGLALVRDHVNLSGRSPLRGIGETPLGPLFPDQSRVHHAGLRARALGLARERGIEAAEAVVACTLGPNLSTPAELRWYAAAGAEVAVQDLASPLIACAHAGLATLAIVALTDSGRDPLRLQQIIERTEACAPALEDLILACAADLAEVARDLEDELP